MTDNPTQLVLQIPEGTRLHGLYWRGVGWGAILSCQPLFWPSKYRETFADLRPPEPKFHSCSAGSEGQTTAQNAIDLAFEKLKLTMSQLDGITRAPTAVTSASVKKEADDLLKLLGL